jgi:lysine 2,3-aminomutase
MIFLFKRKEQLFVKPTVNPPSWKRQIHNSIKSIYELKDKELIPDDQTEIDKLPIRITQYYLSVALKNKKLLKTIIPTKEELIISNDESIDPLAEEIYRKNKCIIHKYPNRVLFLVTKFCSTNCRFCTRSRIVGGNNPIFKNDWITGIEYIRQHPEIQDVLISGGDPLTLSDESLFFILSELRKINHIKILRMGTKIPVVLPDRITGGLINMLKQFSPLYMNIHFTHTAEITSECKEAIKNLLNGGVILGSQTVLLKNVNDSAEELQDLFNELLSIGVRPYYIYNMDKIQGGEHFRCDLDTMINLMKKLVGFNSGLAIPEFIIDTEIGKIPLRYEFITKNENNNYVLNSFEKNQSVMY